MTSDHRISDLEERLVRGLRASGVPGIVSAWLFGSHARGTPHRESDVDVGVLLERGRYADAGARFDARVRLSAELMGCVHRTVDVVVLNDAPPMLGRHVVTRGRRIFSTDPAEEHDYVVYVQIRAADVEPWYRRCAQVKLAAMRR